MKEYLEILAFGLSLINIGIALFFVGKNRYDMAAYFIGLAVWIRQ